jgi:formate dehydrogenase subunit gamma
VKEEWIERYRTPTRVLHWVHAGAFTVLFLTGLILYLSPLAFLAEDSWTRIIHRVAAFIFIIAPLIYIPLNWKSTVRGLADAFKWGVDDLGWAMAAPRYYFLADEKAMPPQGHMNTGQKMWWLMVVVFSAVFVITGLIMWAAKTTAPAASCNERFYHDISFIVAPCFRSYFLSVAHPLMHPMRTRAWSSMASVRYRRNMPVHHADGMKLQ